LVSLPPLDERLKPELAAHGEEFIERMQQANHKPKKAHRKFNFDSGGD